MKPIYAFFLYFGLCFQSYSVLAENPFTATIEGLKLEYVELDKNDKIIGYSIHTIKSNTKTETGALIITQIESFDKDRKPSKDMSAFDSKTLITADKVIIPKENIGLMLDSYGKDINWTFEGKDMEYPLSPQVNQNLKPYTIDVTLNSTKSDKKRKLMTISSEKREITGKEVITIDAVSYDCYKLAETVKIKALLGLGETSYTITWYAPGIGEVMSQKLSKKGKVEKSTKLISITVPN